jgi:hypothetical protein
MKIFWDLLEKNGDFGTRHSPHPPARLLDFKTGELLNEYKGHTNCKYKVGSSLSHHDEWLVTGSEDSGVPFVSANNHGQKISSANEQRNVLKHHIKIEHTHIA